MTITLNHLTLDQLNSLIVEAERRLRELSRRRPAPDVRQELQELAAAEGYSVDDLFDTPTAKRAGRKAGKRKKAKVAPKYQNPEDRRQTWTGRGRTPLWLAEKVKRGHSTADFLIPGLARPTAKKVSSVGRRSVFKRT